jgi:hypothetical protein
MRTSSRGSTKRSAATTRACRPTAPRHAHTGFRTPDEPSSGPPSRAPDALRPLQWFAFSGIGNPQTFLEQLRARGGSCVGHRTFPDHHAYTEADIVDLKQSAATAGAEVIVTTEKDWVKLDPLPSSRAAGPPVWRVDLRIEFEAGRRGEATRAGRPGLRRPAGLTARTTAAVRGGAAGENTRNFRAKNASSAPPITISRTARVPEEPAVGIAVSHHERASAGSGAARTIETPRAPATRARIGVRPAARPGD